jgi:hypothetical protein
MVRNQRVPIQVPSRNSRWRWNASGKLIPSGLSRHRSGQEADARQRIRFFVRSGPIVLVVI